MSNSNTLGNNAFFNRLDAINVNFKNHSNNNNDELLKKIETNTSDIATNTSDIATNTSDIATNTSNIATNTNDIATNTALFSWDRLMARDTSSRWRFAARRPTGRISIRISMCCTN